MILTRLHNGQSKDYPGTQAEIRAAVMADGAPDPFSIPVEDARAAAKAKFNALPDGIRTSFLTAWVLINQLLDLSGSADAVRYFDTLSIPAGFEAQAAAIRSDLASL